MVMMRAPEWRRSTMQPLAFSNGVARATRFPSCAAVCGQYFDLRVISEVRALIASSSAVRVS